MFFGSSVGGSSKLSPVPAKLSQKQRKMIAQAAKEPPREPGVSRAVAVVTPSKGGAMAWWEKYDRREGLLIQYHFIAQPIWKIALCLIGIDVNKQIYYTYLYMTQINIKRDIANITKQLKSSHTMQLSVISGVRIPTLNIKYAHNLTWKWIGVLTFFLLELPCNQKPIFSHPCLQGNTSEVAPCLPVFPGPPGRGGEHCG